MGAFLDSETGKGDMMERALDWNGRFQCRYNMKMVQPQQLETNSAAGVI